MSLMLLLALAALTDVPPVPGLCSAPVPADPDTPGCYQTNKIDLADAPPELFWFIQEYRDMPAAEAEAQKHGLSATTRIHGRNWLYVLGPAGTAIAGGSRRAVIGPLKTPPAPATAHFSEAIFPPGMRTRVHSHPGPEAFYVVEGEQCMETPGDKAVVAAGSTYVVAGGPHLQAAPKGRRNLVLILAPRGQPFVTPGGGWVPTGFCDGPPAPR